MIVLSGSSHPDFVRLICEDLSIRESQVNSTKFANGETGLDINVSVRDQDVFIVQTGCSPVNDIMMELMIIIHACKISAAKRGIKNLYGTIYSIFSYGGAAIFALFEANFFVGPFSQ